MIRSSFKHLVLTAAVGASSLLIGGAQAEAFFFGHSHGSHGSHGSWGGGSWGSHGSHGSHGSWGLHGGSWGSHGGSWGSHGGWGRRHGSWGSHGSHGSHGGSWGSHGGYAYSGSHGSSGGYGSSGGHVVYDGGYNAGYDGAVIDHGAPVQPALPPDQPANPPAPPADGNAPAPLPGPDGSTSLTRDSVLLSVNVPAEAKIYVNETATRSTGAERRYMSRGLQVGREYTYTVRAELNVDGNIVSETKVVKLQAGQTSNLSFDFENAQETVAAKPLRTALILNVPADAKVYLSGKETTSTGPVREFATTRLTAGDQWTDYSVRVEIERGGRTLTKEQSVSIGAGETRELAINFDAPEIARVTTADAGL